jgi:hypothetical protein
MGPFLLPGELDIDPLRMTYEIGVADLRGLASHIFFTTIPPVAGDLPERAGRCTASEKQRNRRNVPATCGTNRQGHG